MKIKTSQETLSKALNMVGRAVATRNARPILSTILLSVDGKRLKLSATNLTTALTCWLDGKVSGQGALAIPAKTLIDVVAAIPAGRDVSLAVKDNALALNVQPHRTTIKGLDAAEFPALQNAEGKGVKRLQFAAEPLRDAIRKAAICAASDSSRPALTGILLKAKDGTATLAATDGYRLSVVELEARGQMPELVVPGESLETLERLLEAEEEVTLSVPADRTRAVFTTSRLQLITQLIEGKYPDYERVMPKATDRHLSVMGSDLLMAVKAVEVFARENEHSACFKVEKDTLTLHGQSAETGSGQAIVPVQLTGFKASDLPFEISLNARFIMDALKAIDGPCQLHLGDARSPVLLTLADGATFKMLIMPLASR